MSLRVASLHLYPIKSLGGFSVHEAVLTDRGFGNDRRWMLVDAAGRFVSQREVAVLACLHCSPRMNGFRVTDVRDGSSVDLPWDPGEGEKSEATVWDDRVSLIGAEAEVHTWFTERVGVPVRLGYMPDSSLRGTETQYAKALTSLSDGFPYLLISLASLEALNARLSDPLPMDRFRPNIVIAGGDAFQEDMWKGIRIGDANFRVVKPCARCVITTTDQRSGVRSKEPLLTLATFRQRDNKVYFGMNAVGDDIGTVHVNDAVSVLDRRGVGEAP